MKLLELTPQLDLTPKRSRRIGDDVVQALKPKNAHEVGRGGKFANAYSTVEEPGTVTKVVRNVKDIKKDAYFKYISALAKNDRISRNPYLPKIYNVRVVKDAKGEFKYSVAMEALHDWDTLSSEEMHMLGEKMFFNYNEYLKHCYAMLNGRYPAKSKGLETYALLTSITKVIDFNSDVSTYIKDPRLKEVCLILRKLIKRGDDIWTDVHAGNVMVRRGPGGPQLVLTDPVS